MDAGPNLVKHSYAAGEMGVGTAKMAAKRAREVKVITCAFTVGRTTAGNRARSQVDVLTARGDEECAAGEIRIGAAKMAALRGREVTVITSAFTPTQRIAGIDAEKNRANVTSAHGDKILKECAAGEIRIGTVKMAALRGGEVGKNIRAF